MAAIFGSTLLALVDDHEWIDESLLLFKQQGKHYTWMDLNDWRREDQYFQSLLKAGEQAVQTPLKSMKAWCGLWIIVIF